MLIVSIRLTAYLILIFIQGDTKKEIIYFFKWHSFTLLASILAILRLAILILSFLSNLNFLYMSIILSDAIGINYHNYQKIIRQMILFILLIF